MDDLRICYSRYSLCTSLRPGLQFSSFFNLFSLAVFFTTHVYYFNPVPTNCHVYAYYELLIISGVLRPRGHELLQDQEGHLDRQRGEYSIYIYIYFYYSYMRDCTYFCQSKGSSWSWLIILYLAERASVCLFFSSKFIHLFTTPLTLIARTPGYSFPWTLDPDSDPDPELYILITS